MDKIPVAFPPLAATGLMTRQAIFISHANPEDNAFTLWLGGRLSAAGYEVWADILKLRGGQDWQRRLEAALRDRACKLLMVGTPCGVDKQGLRNEIQIMASHAPETASPIPSITCAACNCGINPTQFP